jgi:hypothetical protein
MKNLNLLLNLCFLSTCLLTTFAMAQTPSDLVGTWQVQSNGVTYVQIISADGTYTFEAVGQNYLEQGTWQFEGTNYSQQWQDPRTGEAMNETYTVELLGTDSFTQTGGNLQDQVFTFTRTNAQDMTDEPAPEQPATNPLNTPDTQSTAGTQSTPSNQSVPSLTPDQLAQMSIDPETMLIPDEFHCYLNEYSDDYSQFDFALTILPNQQYSTEFGTGDYEVVGDLPIEVSWLSGPFAQEDAYAFAGYDDYGQSLSLYTGGDEELNFDCYQRGPKEEQLLLELAFKDPQPGSYPCVEEDSGSPGPTLELLEGRRYSVDGVEGDYSVGLMGDPQDDLPGIDYLTGAWADTYGFISADKETGNYELSAVTDYGDFECSVIRAPLQGIQFGAATAAPPPAGAGGLEGFYANWQADLMGTCGGMCWKYLYFFSNGYVYKHRPDGLLEQIDCTRTQPNGAPLCDTYTLEGNTIYFSDGERKSLVQMAEGLEIDGKDYSLIPRFDGLLLNGVFEASSFTAAVGGQGGLAIEKTITFYPDGTFTREGFVGASYTATDTGTQFGDPVAGVTTSSESSNNGTYQIQGNAITFNYADGQVSTDFFFVIPGEDPSNPGAIRVGGWDFLSQE